MLYPTNKIEIIDYFIHFIKPENNGKALIIWAAEHYVAGYFLDGNFYYFDSNDEIEPSENAAYSNQPLGKLISAQNDNYNCELMDLINNSFFKNEASGAMPTTYDWGPTQYPINIRVVDLLGRKPGQYPTKESLELSWQNNLKDQTSYKNS